MARQKCWVRREAYGPWAWWVVGCQFCGKLVDGSSHWLGAMRGAHEHAQGHR